MENTLAECSSLIAHPLQESTPQGLTLFFPPTQTAVYTANTLTVKQVVLWNKGIRKLGQNCYIEEGCSERWEEVLLL